MKPTELNQGHSPVNSRSPVNSQLRVNCRSVAKVMMLCSVVMGLPNALIAQKAKTELSDSKMSPSMVELQKRLSAVNSLAADFVQKKLADSAQQCSEIPQTGNDRKAFRGQMKVARPGKLYWKTEPPFEQLTLADGKTLWVYDPDLEQVTIKQLDDSIQQSPATVLSGSIEDIARQYDVFGTQTSDEYWKFAFIPKSQEVLFSRLELTFDQHDRVSSMLIDDGLGQRTCFRFSNVNYNIKLPETLFRFEVPKGVDVIHESGFLGPKSALNSQSTVNSQSTINTESAHNTESTLNIKSAGN